MPKIIDATLTMLDEFQITKEQIERMICLLQELSITSIVISPKIYKVLDGSIPEKTETFLEIPFSQIIESDLYPNVEGFISSSVDGYEKNVRNMQINDLLELLHLPAEYMEKRLRITGLDDLLIYGSDGIYQRGMENLKSLNPFFYPENSYSCATAIALNYLQFHQKGTIMSTFMGIGNKAATEQILLALRVVERYKPNICFGQVTKLRDLFEEITGYQISPNAPVIGRNIFHIESGVHVAGILKKPSNYEAYPPELVGAKRKIVLGKHSGMTSIRYKLEQLGVEQPLNEERIAEKVKRLSIKKSGALTDEEFLEIIKEECAECEDK